jgi:hypothetical protein
MIRKRRAYLPRIVGDNVMMPADLDAVMGPLASLAKTSSRTRPSSGVIQPRCIDDRQNRVVPSRNVVRPHERACETT